MRCIVLFGPSAVGKATVGRELAARTGFTLFHNHQVIELVHQFFTWSDPGFWPLVSSLRHRVFESLKTAALPGVIFTYVWALDQDSDHQEVLSYLASLGAALDETVFVELSADQPVRLERNRDPRRLADKKTKQNVAESERFLLDSERTYRLNTAGDFFYPDRHLKIDNTALNPAETADRIVKAVNGFSGGFPC